MVKEYYLALFNDKIWNDFRESGRNIYGTTKNKENRAKNYKKETISSATYPDGQYFWIDGDYFIMFPGFI